MKEDLKRLLNEFLEETHEGRTEIVKEQFTKDSKITEKYVTSRPTLDDLISWLND